MDLPDGLRVALAHELATTPQKNIANATAELSRRYRARARDGQPPNESSFLRSQTDVAAYAAYRLPATFAAIYASLNEVSKRRPEWRPRTLLDVGAGPGTAMWASCEIWPYFEHITLLERDDAMIDFGKRISTHTRSAAMREAIWQKADLLGKWESPPHELVIAAYVLGELPQLQREKLVERLWSITLDTLLIIEPGTPSGFALVRQVRQQLIDRRATIIAPCPHNQPCPMPENDWCHFAQRISRTQLHRQVKKATLSYEDEKFSYVAMARTKSIGIAGRVIRHPQIRPGHIYLELCTPAGLKSTIVTRKDREEFRQARDLHWGDAL